jgi:BirA family transcriptional regulator, biotin operon repressor / biotin---[acetyl-CoA-carboxylase] ligase
MSLKIQLLKLLADGKFHSGEELGKRLGVSRSAIWKTVQDFQELGIEVCSVKRKGYQIPKGIELLDSDYILGCISPEIKKEISVEILFGINSTNQYLLDHLKLKPSGSIVLAEFQTNGRGRRNRKWISPCGTNLYFSILWSFDKDPSELCGLSLAAGIAVANTLERYGIPHIQLKWPNDVLWCYKKIAGVLIEMTAETYSSTQVVIGIGLNLQMSNTADIDQEWIDLMRIIHRKPERNLIASILIEEVVAVLKNFQHKGFASYFKHWQALDAFLGKRVKLSTPTQVFHGISKGINPQGEFILVDNIQNKERCFFHGEISLTLDS